LAFVIFRHNWKDKLKWVCFLLVLANFSFDLLSFSSSKTPVSSGIIVTQSPSDSGIHKVLLHIKKGNVCEGEFIKTAEWDGIIKKLSPDNNRKFETWAEIETSASQFNSPANFEVFSTLNIVNISLLVELVLTFLIFFLILTPTRKSLGRLSLVVLFILALVWSYRNLILDNLYTSSALYNGGSTIIIILFALTFFYYQLNRPDNRFIYAAPSFWIVSAILIFKAGTFFLFLYGNTLDQAEKANFYAINSVFYVVENILFAVAFILRRKDSSTTSKRPILI
jgi:hypothetical protein